MCLFQNKLLKYDVINKTVEAGKNEYARSCELCHGVTSKRIAPSATRNLE